MEATPKNVSMLTVVSFVGAFAAAFSGAGPGTVFVPYLVVIGVNPGVATSTGMYLTFYTTLSASI